MQKHWTRDLSTSLPFLCLPEGELKRCLAFREKLLKQPNARRAWDQLTAKRVDQNTLSAFLYLIAHLPDKGLRRQTSRFGNDWRSLRRFARNLAQLAERIKRVNVLLGYDAEFGFVLLPSDQPAELLLSFERLPQQLVGYASWIETRTGFLARLARSTAIGLRRAQAIKALIRHLTQQTGRPAYAQASDLINAAFWAVDLQELRIDPEYLSKICKRAPEY